MSRSFFDTNVLLYMYEDDEPQKKARAIDVFDRAVEGNLAVLSTQVLQEFYVNATRKLTTPLSPERAAARVRDFARLPLVRVDEAMILAAIERNRDMSFSFWDALVVEAALRGRGRTPAHRGLAARAGDGRTAGGEPFPVTPCDSAGPGGAI